MWRRHRFASLEEHGDQDNVVASSEFIVHYIASICYYEDSEKTNQSLKEFLKTQITKFRMKKSSLLRLNVDLSEVILHGRESRAQARFKMCNIKGIIYGDSIQAYSKCFILVGKEESDPGIKAHVLVCENKEKARRLYQIFIELFELGAEMTRRRHESDSDSYSEDCGEKLSPFDQSTNTHKSTLNSSNRWKPSLSQEITLDPFVNSHQLPKWNTPSVPNCPMDQQRNSEADLDDGFTKLAISRSSSTDMFPLATEIQTETRLLHFPPSQDDVFW